MSVPFQPHGVWTALVTPFNDDGSMNIEAFKKNVEFQIVEGIAGILPAGTTGESPTLRWSEHNQVIEEAIEFAKGRVGVLAGTGSNSTEEAIEGTRHAQEVGASAALIVDCYYNGPSSLELRTRILRSDRGSSAGHSAGPIHYSRPLRDGNERGGFGDFA